MSELSIFDGGLPAYLKNAELDETTKALMGGSSQYKRLSIKGNVFRLYVDGKEMLKSDDRSMEVVVVAAAPKVSRTWYAKSFTEGEGAIAPNCWSGDGEVPDAKVKDKQANRCLDCKQNVNGSGPNNTRACRYSQRLAVVSANNIGGDVLQLQLPAQSIFGAGQPSKLPLQAYAKLIGSKGIPITAVVTEMRFDTDSATPKLTFKPVRVLTTDEHALAIAQGKTEDATRAIEFTVAESDKPKIAYEEPEPVPAAKTKPAAVKPKVVEEPDDDIYAAPEPVKKAKPVVEEDDDIPEPTVRSSKKQEAPPKKDLSDILAEWDD